MKITHVAILVMALGGFQCLSVAHALPRHLTVNASGACQSALPVFDGQIRKRPLGVQNEGIKPAFISCSYYSVGPYGLTLGVNMVRVYVASNNHVASTVSCLGISGYNDGNAQYVLKSVNVPADNSQVAIDWTASDFVNPLGPTFPYSNFNLSCNLIPGTGVNQSEIYYDDAT